MAELSFNYIVANSALDRILFGCMTFMVGRMCCELQFLGTAGGCAGIPMTCRVRGEDVSFFMSRKCSVLNLANITDRLLPLILCHTQNVGKAAELKNSL